MKQYRNLVFDVGNVLLSYRWREMLTEDYGLTPEQRDDFARKIMKSPLWEELDHAILPYEEVVELYVEQFPEWAEVIRWFFYHTERMPVDRPAVWEKIRELKNAGYRIYILSNYPEYMFVRHTEGKPFMDLLDGRVVSYEVREIKPHPEIYRALYELCGLHPEESLFFDDRPENVEGAIACGMDAVQVTSEEQLLEELEKLPDPAG